MKGDGFNISLGQCGSNDRMSSTNFYSSWMYNLHICLYMQRGKSENFPKFDEIKCFFFNFTNKNNFYSAGSNFFFTKGF